MASRARTISLDGEVLCQASAVDVDGLAGDAGGVAPHDHDKEGSECGTADDRGLIRIKSLQRCKDPEKREERTW